MLNLNQTRDHQNYIYSKIKCLRKRCSTVFCVLEYNQVVILATLSWCDLSSVKTGDQCWIVFHCSGCCRGQSRNCQKLPMSHFAFYYCDLDLSNLEKSSRAPVYKWLVGWVKGLNSSKPKGLTGRISHSNIMNRLVVLYQNTGAIGRTTSLVLMENR